jgi:anti-anti-sigma factor
VFEVKRQANELHVRMSAVLENIDAVCQVAKQFLLELQLREHVFTVMLGIRETLSNAVIHGSHSDPTKVVELHVAFDGDSLLLETKDQGAGFNWRDRGMETPNPCATTGRGFAILREYFDAVVFNEDGACVMLNKNCTKGAGMSTINYQGENAVISPENDIVASMAQPFREKLKEIVDHGVKELIVDLAQVEMIDSIGMGLLIATHNSLTKSGGKLSLINASADIFGLLRTMRLDKHFLISARG